MSSDDGVTAGLSDDELAEMYHLMLVTTLADERSAREAKAGRLQAAFYPVRGMEAVCAAMGAVLDADDKMVSTYRNLGDALAKGATLRSIMAELYGRAPGMSGGKGGPMHLQDQAVGFTATTGIVGQGLPLAVGLAMATQLDGESRSIVTTFGDGATSIGTYHESMNFAALWKLPIVFICQNNQWGEHTAIADYAPDVELAKRAASYAMPTQRVDGFDPIASTRAIREAVERARAGGGPTFLEFMHYRLTGHTGTADFSYVPKDELAAAMERDPAPNFRRWLAERGIFDDDALTEIERRAQADVDDAFTYAEASPFPDPATIDSDVFADPEFVRSLNHD